MKKTLSLILALLMILSCATTLLAADDVAILDTALVETATAPSKYQKAVDFLAGLEIYKGKSADNQATEDDIERYQMALFVTRLATGYTDDALWASNGTNATTFTDVEGEWVAKYMGAIAYAQANGIIEGYGDGTFGPHDGITYQNALTMVCRTLGYKNADWPWGYITKGIELGLTAGIEGVAYTDVLTRGEVAQILYNALFAEDGKLAANFNMNGEWIQAVLVATPDGKLTGDYSKVTKDNAGSDYKDFVAVEKVNADGTFGGKIYYAEACVFGFAGDHDDEAALGSIYNVFINKNDEIKVAVSTEIDGIEDRDSFEIDAFLSAKKLVTKFAADSKFYYANNTIEKQFILLNTTIGQNELGKKNGKEYAIDWTTGDILVKETKDDVAGDYTVAWYYNTILDAYFETVKGEKGAIIGVNYMTDAELAEWTKLLQEVSTVGKKVTKTVISADKPAKYGYADLQLFDTDADDEAEYGIYTKYVLGNFKKSDIVKDGRWLAADSIDVDEAMAIYTRNDNTGKVKVIKVLDPEYGTVRGYNAGKAEININGETKAVGYNYLDGAIKNDNVAALAEILNPLFNQYVKYYTLNGQIVKIALENKTANLLVVQSYAGINKDGNIVINAYNTADCKLKQYVIGAINGWECGDVYWYGNQEAFMKMCGKGQLLSINSYDNVKDLYYVDYLAEYATTPYTIEVTDKSGYKMVTEGTKDPKAVKMADGDRYVLILVDDEGKVLVNDEYAPVVVRTGKLNEGVVIKGDKVDGADVYFVKAADCKKIDFNVTKTGFTYGLYTTGAYKAATYNDELYGEAKYVATVLNLYTGEEIDVAVANKVLKAGRFYPVQNRQIPVKLGYDGFGWSDFVAQLDEASNAYIFFQGNLTAKDVKTADGVNKDEFSYKYSQKKFSKDYKGFVDSVSYIKLTVKGDDITAYKFVTGDDIAKLEGLTYVALYKDAKVLVYAIDGWKVTEDTEDFTVATKTDADLIKIAASADSEDPYCVAVKATISGTKTVETDNTTGTPVETKTFTIDTIDLAMVGVGTKDHEFVLANKADASFGDGNHGATTWDITVDGHAHDYVLGFYTCAEEGCKEVNEVEIDLAEAIEIADGDTITVTVAGATYTLTVAIDADDVITLTIA